MDPLGIISNKKTPVQSLEKWSNSVNFQESLQAEHINCKPRISFDPAINSKIVLWSGDIASLDAHAIVSTTNEALTDISDTRQHILDLAGPDLEKDLRKRIQYIKTGEVKLTQGFQLHARYIIHAVGPRFSSKYETAAENALFTSYRNILQLAKEHRLKTVGLWTVHSSRRAYPSEAGAHIALRTVRRFLEKGHEDFETIVFCSNEADYGVYSRLMGQYFPRSPGEAAAASQTLPQDLGHPTSGEPVDPDRQIRIVDKPFLSRAAGAAGDGTTASSPTTQGTKEDLLGYAGAVGSHEFARMHEDVDLRRRTSSSGSGSRLTLTPSHLATEQRRRYERLMRRARKEDFADVVNAECIFKGGVDTMGRPIICIAGRNFPPRNVPADRVLLYFLHLIDPLITKGYSMVYFTDTATSPDFTLIKATYTVALDSYQKNLRSFYIVHAGIFARIRIWFYFSLHLPTLKTKLQYLPGVEHLYLHFRTRQINIPEFILQHDFQTYGTNYVEQQSGEDSNAL